MRPCAAARGRTADFRAQNLQAPTDNRAQKRGYQLVFQDSVHIAIIVAGSMDCSVPAISWFAAT